MKHFLALWQFGYCLSCQSQLMLYKTFRYTEGQRAGLAGFIFFLFLAWDHPFLSFLAVNDVYV